MRGVVKTIFFWRTITVDLSVVFSLVVLLRCSTRVVVWLTSNCGSFRTMLSLSFGSVLLISSLGGVSPRGAIDSLPLNDNVTDSCAGHLGPDFCMVNDGIPCHDSSCQIVPASYDVCQPGDNVTTCATRALAKCQALADCVAFGLCTGPGCPAGHNVPWVEFYNTKATSQPLPTPDWTYFFNETALGVCFCNWSNVACQAHSWSARA